MNAQLWAGGAAVVVGVAATLIGFRLRGPSRGRYGLLLKFGGPLLAIGGVAVCVLFRPAAEPWERHTTSDGACSAEFPAPPERDVQTAADRTVTDSLTAARPDRNAHFALSFSDLSDVDAARPLADVFNDLRSIYAAPRSNAPRADLLREEAKEMGGVPGREYHFAVAGGLVSRIAVFVKGRRVYRAIAVYPPGAAADRDGKRFIESFRFEVKP